VTRTAPAPPSDGAPDYAFLRSRRWVVGHVLVLVIVAGCVVAGFWQLDRLHQRRASNARIESRLSQPAVPLEPLLTQGADADALAYRRVVATGTYDTTHEAVLFGRTLRDETGNNLLTPLRLAGGDALVVNRGWVPYAVGAPRDPSAVPPAGAVEVTGVLMPAEKDTAEPAGTPPKSIVATIDVGVLQAGTAEHLLPVYLWLQSQSPPQPGDVPRAVPLPPLSEGPHFSYAVQWFTFALIGIIGYPLLIRREASRRRHAEVART